MTVVLAVKPNKPKTEIHNTADKTGAVKKAAPAKEAETKKTASKK